MKEIKITKEQALEMHQSGVDSLKSIAESNFPELFYMEKKWEDFGKLKGFYLDIYSRYHRLRNDNFSSSDNRNTNPTIKECRMDRAMCQLRQWRDKANGESIFDWCDWRDSYQDKYCIYREGDEIFKGLLSTTYEELTFKTYKIRDQFLKDHKTLIRTAFGL